MVGTLDEINILASVVTLDSIWESIKSLQQKLSVSTVNLPALARTSDLSFPNSNFTMPSPPRRPLGVKERQCCFQWSSHPSHRPSIPPHVATNRNGERWMMMQVSFPFLSSPDAMSDDENRNSSLPFPSINSVRRSVGHRGRERIGTTATATAA